MKRYLLSLLLLAPLAQAETFHRWSVSNWVAATPTSSAGIVLSVSFPPSEQCDSAAFIVIGRGDISQLLLRVDDSMDVYRAVLAPQNRHEDVVGFYMVDEALRRMKNGHRVEIQTDKGAFTASLKGSSAAFKAAYQNCMQAVEPQLAPMTPGGIAPTFDPASDEVTL